MTNNLGQPTVEEIAEKFCDMCNAVLCAGCPIFEGISVDKPAELEPLTQDK